MLFTSVLLLGAIAAIVLLSARWKFNVFFVLLGVASLTGLCAGLDPERMIGLLKAGMGHTFEKIGLLIILGITLGTFLEKSGATSALAHAVLRRTGEANAPLAMAVVGYIVGLPIFCDSGFVVLSGLALSLSAQSKGKHLWLVLALATGLYGVHCLVPPHPGITAAAGTLQADLGLLMVLGAAVAVPTTVAGYFMAKWQQKRFGEAILPLDTTIHHLPQQTDNLPPIGQSLLPIFVPVLLIALKSVLGLQVENTATNWWWIVKLAGEPVVALLVGIVLALPLFHRGTGHDFSAMSASVLSRSGHIILIVAAGGAFGEVIKALNIGEVFGPVLTASGLGLLVPFLLAVVLKTAQGSSTVAVMSAASMVLPLLPALGFDSEMGRVLALLAMGAGSICVSHTNDAYFWVVSQFGAVETGTMLRTYSLMTLAMGLVAMVVVLMMGGWMLG
jgi:gluconate:H+ symporter, GntP family